MTYDVRFIARCHPAALWKHAEAAINGLSFMKAIQRSLKKGEYNTGRPKCGNTGKVNLALFPSWKVVFAKVWSFMRMICRDLTSLLGEREAAYSRRDWFPKLPRQLPWLLHHSWGCNSFFQDSGNVHCDETIAMLTHLHAAIWQRLTIRQHQNSSGSNSRACLPLISVS